MHPLFPWWAASLLANMAIAVIEYLNRTGGYPNFRSALVHTGPLILIGQLGLFYAWRDAPSFMFAWAFFSVMNAAVRLVSNYWFVQEALTPLTLLGVAVMVGGAYLVKIGG